MAAMTEQLIQTDEPSVSAAGLALVDALSKVVRGQTCAVELTVVAILSGSHMLIEDVPGSGKTTLARSVAACLGRPFSRIQGTADLLPADLTGSMVWHPGRASFEFLSGPIFTSILLADEVNRMPPRTQSALLEGMEERRVTIDGVSHSLPNPFIVVATQNPRDEYGTYPLPESMLDRFGIRLWLEPLSVTDELTVVTEQLCGPTSEDVRPVQQAQGLAGLVRRTRRTYVAESVMRYAVELVRATRQSPHVQHGAGSRASLALVRCAQALAQLRARSFVTPEDVRELAPFVIGHRLTWTAHPSPAESTVLLNDMFDHVPVPLET
jgi:MoxR-like ATPase